MFDEERKKQLNNIARIEKIEVKYVGVPEEAIMIMNRDRVTLASQRVADHHLADRLRDTTSWRSELASRMP